MLSSIGKGLSIPALPGKAPIGALEQNVCCAGDAEHSQTIACTKHNYASHITTTDAHRGMTMLLGLGHILMRLEQEQYLYTDLKLANVSEHCTSLSMYKVKPMLIDVHSIVAMDDDGKFIGTTFGTRDLMPPEMLGQHGEPHATAKSHSHGFALIVLAYANKKDPFYVAFQRCASLGVFVKPVHGCDDGTEIAHCVLSNGSQCMSFGRSPVIDWHNMAGQSCLTLS